MIFIIFALFLLKMSISVTLYPHVVIFRPVRKTFRQLINEQREEEGGGGNNDDDGDVSDGMHRNAKREEREEEEEAAKTTQIRFSCSFKKRKTTRFHSKQLIPNK